MMRGLEDWLLDGTFVLRGKRATATKVLLVDIDDQSLDQLKKPLLFLSPELAETVDYLNDQGVGAIGLDVLIPQSYSSLRTLQSGAEGDATPLGLAIERSGKVVLPEWRVEGETLRPLVQWQLKALGDLAPVDTEFGLVNLTEDGDHFVRRQQLAAQRAWHHELYVRPCAWWPGRGKRQSPGSLNINNCGWAIWPFRSIGTRCCASISSDPQARSRS